VYSHAQISKVGAFSSWLSRAAGWHHAAVVQQLRGEHLEVGDRGGLAQPTVFLGQNKLLFQQKFRV